MPAKIAIFGGWLIFWRSKQAGDFMKYVLFAAAVCAIFGGSSVNAEPGKKASWRVADATNACLINCASERDSCKRLCPATFNTPCIDACDNQAQFCRQNCQRR